MNKTKRQLREIIGCQIKTYYKAGGIPQVFMVPVEVITH